MPEPTSSSSSAQHVREALTKPIPVSDDWDLTGQACPIDAGEDCEACS